MCCFFIHLVWMPAAAIATSLLRPAQGQTAQMKSALLAPFPDELVAAQIQVCLHCLSLFLEKTPVSGSHNQASLR